MMLQHNKDFKRAVVGCAQGMSWARMANLNRWRPVRSVRNSQGRCSMHNGGGNAECSTQGQAVMWRRVGSVGPGNCCHAVPRSGECAAGCMQTSVRVSCMPVLQRSRTSAFRVRTETRGNQNDADTLTYVYPRITHESRPNCRHPRNTNWGWRH